LAIIRTARFVSLVLLTLAGIALVGALRLGLPQWLAFLLFVPAVLLVVFLQTRLMARSMLTPAAQDPVLIERVRACCAEAGFTPAQVTVVTGDGLPYLRVRGGQVEISVRAGELLNDGELRAVLYQGALSPQNQAARLIFRWLLPWGIALAVAVILSLILRWPVVSLVIIAALIWFPYQVRRGLVFKGDVAAQLRAFREAGGSLEDLAAALLKLNAEAYRRGLLNAGSIVQLRGLILLAAELGQVPPERLEWYAMAAGAPAELIREPASRR
jgi:hypothetical protein